MSDTQTPQAPDSLEKQASTPTSAQPDAHVVAASTVQAPEERKPKRKGLNPFVKALIWILVIIAVFILGLVISAFIAGFDSVFEMIDWIIAQIQT